MIRPLICTPAYGEKVFVNYAKSLLKLAMVCTGAGIEIEILFRSDSLITRARNDCADIFLKGDFTHLVFVDADIGFKPADLLNLCLADKPVICGNYRQKRPEIVYAGHGVTDVDDKGIGKIKYAPTGFMCIRRDVFEAIKPYSAMVGDKHAYFDTLILGEEYLSEDYAFTKRCERAGIDVLVDTTIKLSHQGSAVYE